MTCRRWSHSGDSYNHAPPGPTTWLSSSSITRAPGHRVTNASLADSLVSRRLLRNLLNHRYRWLRKARRAPVSKPGDVGDAALSRTRRAAGRGPGRHRGRRGSGVRGRGRRRRRSVGPPASRRARTTARRSARERPARPAGQRRARRRRARRRRRPGPGRRAARQTASTSLSTPGSSGSASAATAGLPRSAASAYCVRSLVPMLKKSTCGDERGGLQRRRRHLDHDRRPGARPAAPRPPSATASSSRRRASTSSSTVLTIGNITLTGVSWATSTIARSWSRSRSLLGQREPDAADTEERVGLRAAGERRPAACRRRRRGCAGSAGARPAPRRARGRPATCSSTVGCVGAVEEQELGPDQPGQVGAVQCRGCGVLDGAEVGPDLTSTPSAVTAGLCAASSARAARARARSSSSSEARAGCRRPGRRRPARSSRRARWSCRRERPAPRVPRPRRPGWRGTGPGWRCGRSGCRRRAPRPGPGSRRGRRPGPGSGRRRPARRRRRCAVRATPTRTRATCCPTSRTSAARARR